MYVCTRVRIRSPPSPELRTYPEGASRLGSNAARLTRLDRVVVFLDTGRPDADRRVVEKEPGIRIAQYLAVSLCLYNLRGIR